MSNAPHQSSEACTHERRPGTTVCLRCRHATRAKASDQRKRLMLRGGAATIVAATFIAAASLGATAIRAKGEAHRATVAVAAPVRDSAVVQLAAKPADSAATTPAVVMQTTPAPVAKAPPAAPLKPILAEGESPLIDSVTAFRADSVVTVSFDAQTVRTRNGEKFEHFVRTTLPAIYGHAVDSVLAKMPLGTIASQGSVVAELPTRGIHIPLDAGWTIQLFPETRPGSTGPIVVRYRVAVVNSAQ